MAIRRMVVSSVCVALLAPGSQIFASDISGHAGSPAVVARSGGFPALQPRAAETRDRLQAGPIEQPTYRVRGSVEKPVHAADEQPAESRSEIPGGGLALQSNPESSRSKMMAPLVTVTSSLAIVLALFSALVWAGRKFGGRATASKPLPAAALAPLGHVMLDPRTKLLLVKCGRRILVLSQTASGITPLTEVSHPDEVQELIASCSAEARQAFEQTLREVELESTRGIPETQPSPPTARQSGRLFATA
ncbi:Flagellar biosynthesis protein, FliO [Allorhodopirellula solitaria]|uniref:Flagellar biosynthesis protein, FliO n=2 Tax=Allorhodopirellula solitaria TaxID=2527987 RepID=A0A5C5YGW7_9BACT|nr:Flagellar biosynthesis protein, FliO [Allorhodopirellula solitaria]